MVLTRFTEACAAWVRGVKALAWCDGQVDHPDWDLRREEAEVRLRAGAAAVDALLEWLECSAAEFQDLRRQWDGER